MSRTSSAAKPREFVREKPTHREIRPLDFLENSGNLRITPYRASTRGLLAEPLAKIFDYADNVVNVLKARNYQPKSSSDGITLEEYSAKEDFFALCSAMVAVLSSVGSTEVAKIFDLDLTCVYHHYDINSMVFTMLSVLLRGSALAVYHTTAKRYPFDGRALLLRLHFEVEGFQPVDRGRYMEDMRSLRVNEREDPRPIINQFPALAEKHCHSHHDFSFNDRAETFLVVIEKSADSSPYEVALYQGIIEDLFTSDSPLSFDTVALRVRRVWQRDGTRRLARFLPPECPTLVVMAGVWSLIELHQGALPLLRVQGRLFGRARPAFRSGPCTATHCISWGPVDCGQAATVGVVFVHFRGPRMGWRMLYLTLCTRPTRWGPLISLLSTDDDEPAAPTLAMIAGYDEEGDATDWPAFREGPVYIPGSATP
ncbi:hypothetical protein CYMTET_52072 [Cymbomonas tetramitiformis]|uniref:Uncharacterized protein n=1 Tax=Cymbomonas tetramitiformis TaxID=36881 RepID=A0AAE0BLK3_9CHLO|nr:hypothetical protein CYMTET_52072 [Cymbomonas tetramitiformis]